MAINENKNYYPLHVLIFSYFPLHIGFKEIAEYYLNKFKWGNGFLTLNNHLLSDYSNCSNSTEVVTVQNEYLKNAESERQNRRKYYYLN